LLSESIPDETEHRESAKKYVSRPLLNRHRSLVLPPQETQEDFRQRLQVNDIVSQKIRQTDREIFRDHHD
jgi:hypothetical protein